MKYTHVELTNGYALYRGEDLIDQGGGNLSVIKLAGLSEQDGEFELETLDARETLLDDSQIRAGSLNGFTLTEAMTEAEHELPSWPYKDTSEGAKYLEQAVRHSASHDKDRFLTDAATAWDRVTGGLPVCGAERMRLVP